MPDLLGFPPLTADEFDGLVAKTELPVCIYLTRKCGEFTRRAHQEFLTAAADFKDKIAFFEVDVDAEKALASRLNVKGVPILLHMSSGTEQSALLGFHSVDELRKRLWSIISTGGDV